MTPWCGMVWGCIRMLREQLWNSMGTKGSVKNTLSETKVSQEKVFFLNMLVTNGWFTDITKWGAMLVPFVHSGALTFFAIKMLNRLTVHPIFQKKNVVLSPGFSGGIPGWPPGFETACSISVVPQCILAWSEAWVLLGRLESLPQQTWKLCMAMGRRWFLDKSFLYSRFHSLKLR